MATATANLVKAAPSIALQVVADDQPVKKGTGKPTSGDSYDAKSAWPLQPGRIFRSFVSSVFQDPIEAEIEKVDDAITTAKPADQNALLDHKKVLIKLMGDRDLVDGLKITNLTVACSAKKTIADLERLARTPEPSEDAIRTVHEHVVLLQDYARLEGKNAWLRQHCNGKTRLAPSGRDALSLIAREFMTMDSAAGEVFNRFRESDNPADRDVAKVIDKALSKQSAWNDWDKRDPSDWKALSREVKELKGIYDSPEWKIFADSLIRETAPEYNQALADMDVLPNLLEDFKTIKPEDITTDQITGIRVYLLDRLQARENAILEEMEPYLYVTGEFGAGKIKVPKYDDLDPRHLELGEIVDKLYKMDDATLAPELLELRKTALHLTKLKASLESIDLNDKKDSLEVMEKVALSLDRGKRAQLKHALLGLAERVEKIPVKEEALTEDSTVGDDHPMVIRREISSLFLDKELSDKEVAQGASKIISMTSRASYIRLAECRVQELESKLKEISSANKIGINATKAAVADDYRGINDEAIEKMEAAHTAEETEMNGLLAEYRSVLTSLKDKGDQGAAIEKFCKLEKSKLHETIQGRFEDAELLNTFTKGMVVTVAAIATGGLAASLVPEAFATTTLGGFVTLGVETAAFTISAPIYRSMLDFESPLKPIKEMWDKPGELGERIVTNMVVFGALRESTRVFGEAFSALVKREGAQTVLKEMGDFLAKIEKDPALRAELSAGIQKTFVNVGSQGGALITQTGVLQVSDFIQTAKALMAAGDNDPIGHALEKTFAPRTVLKEFAFNLGLHFAPMPSHGPKEKAAEAPSFNGEIEKTMAACGAKESDNGRITYDPAKKEALLGRFRSLKAVSDAKGLGVEFNFLGTVVEVSIPTPFGIQTYTFQPHAAAN